MNMVHAARGMRAPASVGVCIALAALVGCGNATKATVAGKVTYKGSPLTGGALTLHPAQGGGPFSVFIRTDGTFNVGDAPIGPMDVAISTDDVVDASPAGSVPPELKPAKKVAIPERYKDPETSGLRWDVKPGMNARDFDLTDTVTTGR